MSRFRPRRSGVLVLALSAVVVIVGLLIAGSRTISVRTFALRVQNATPVAVVARHHEACEGTVISSGTAQVVEIFGTPSADAPQMRVSVLSTRDRTLAVGVMRRDVGATHQVALDHPVRGGVAVRVCVAASDGSFTLLGAAGQAPGITTRGVEPNSQFSLVLLRRSSFLRSLDTAFVRAAIFRPRWVGAWTFWILLGVLVATLGLAGRAVASASVDDDDA